MKIKYNIRGSTFLLPIKAALQQNAQRLRRGASVSLSLAAGGFPGRITITIDPKHLSSFPTDWNNNDHTWFPARIKAAATALRDLGFAGSFEIWHEDGLLKLRRV